MAKMIRDLDVVQLTADQTSGLVEGARGTVVSVQATDCTVEFLDREGYTIGLFEISKSDLIVVDYVSGASVARED